MLCRRSIFPKWLGFCFSGKKSQQQQQYYESRIEQLSQHRYPHFYPTITVADFHHQYLMLKEMSESAVKGLEKVCGRVSAIRAHGKTTFIDILEEHVRLQIAISKDNETLNKVRRGDIIGVTGNAFVTKKGELSLNALEVEIVSPCLWMLPEHESLKDPESRYRKKYLDLFTNKSSLDTLKKRSKIISSLRQFLELEGYIEVETPILSSSCGGAIAKPFTTYHNDHKISLYMRIAPELYLKKLVIGGMSRVFQIGKNFRNQSIDQTHNPEYTGCELYCAYSDYEKMIQLTHRLINDIATKVNGSRIFLSSEGKEIDLGEKWEQVDFMEGLEKALGIQLPIDFESEKTEKFYDEICSKNNVPCDEPRTIQRLLDKLGEKYLQTSIQPLIIKNHPKIMSPLAKPIPSKPHLTQRFELFINGWEIVNSYTELNIPQIQRENTPTQTQFIEALEYGLVPCAGWGIGIDRLVMLLTQKQRIQEVLAFPLLREKSEEVV